MKGNIIFVVGTLNEIGGGEKLLLEGVKYYRSVGFEVYIITWSFDEKALFNNHYENKNIIVLGKKHSYTRKDIFKRSFDRLTTLLELRGVITKINPFMIFTQGEYDVATLYISIFLKKFKYVFLIFGQNFQFSHDIGKYSLIFKKHLKQIVNSQKGYRDTIPLKKPKVNFLNNLTNEIVSLIRYLAVRKATKLFAFSESVSWETELLFNRKPLILKGAFSQSIFSEQYDVGTIKIKYNIPLDKKILLSFSRLVPKKRIELAILVLKELDLNYHLIIAGEGPDEKRLRELVAKEKLDQKVTFLGLVPETDANGLKSAADVFLSLDIGDFDISPLEAMAFGVKVIVPKEFNLDDNLKTFNNLKQIEANLINLKIEIINSMEERSDDDYKKRIEIYSWENYFKTILDVSRC